MSYFNDYAQKANKIATEAFEKYQKAEVDYKKAQKTAEEYPQRYGFVDPQYAAKSARAKADFLEAKESMKTAKDEFESHIKEFSALREKLAQEVDEYYGIDPRKLDANTLEILKSGIMKPGEYSRLLNEAQENENYTMMRMVSKYAADAAESEAKRNGYDSPTAMELRAVSYQGNTDPGAIHLQQFDVLAECYTRSVNNPAMIKNWEQLTADIVENF